MKRAVLATVGAILLFFGQAAQTEVVKDLHSAEVPVADRSQEALSEASRDGLVQVLIKVSGSVDVLDNPEERRAMEMEAFRRFNSRFHRDVMYKNYRSLYE